MKCPKCGQTMIDEKDYCVNCGTKLRERKEVSAKKVLILFAVLIVLGIGACYGIINFNTDKEIEPYLPQNNEEKEKTTIEEETEVNEEVEAPVFFPDDFD